MRFLEQAYDVLVVLFGILLYGISLIPSYFLVRWGHGLGFPWAVFTYPVAFYLFIVTLVLLTGAIKTYCIPRLKPGTYRIGKDPHANAWFVSRTITEYVLTPFDRIICTNDYLRQLCLRLYGAKLARSSVISSSFISDFDLLEFGENCMIGGWAVLYGHVEPEPGLLILGAISIGDHTMIGARANIGCGTSVGSHTVIGFGSVTGVNCKIGVRCNVGYLTSMGHHVKLADDVKVGKCCSLGNGVQVRQGIKLPDFSMVPDFTIVSSQQMAEGYRLVRTSEAQSLALHRPQGVN